MDVVTRLADRIIVLQHGMLVADGPPAEVVALADCAASLSWRSRRRRNAAWITTMTGADRHLLRLDGVHTNIGRYRILHGVDLAVRRGRVTMLLGRNGAGKTTTLRTIMGLWQARRGKHQFRRPADHCARHAAYRPVGHRLCAGDDGHLRPAHGSREHAARHRARAASTRNVCSSAARAVPGAEAEMGIDPPASCRVDRSRCWRSAAPSSNGAACC